MDIDTVNLENCCRTCLRQQQNNMKPLSSNWNNSLTFVHMLSDIQILDQQFLCNPLHLKICGSCEVDLVSAYNFKLVCQQTERILRELSQSQSKSQSVREESDERNSEQPILEDKDNLDDSPPINSGDSSRSKRALCQKTERRILRQLSHSQSSIRNSVSEESVNQIAEQPPIQDDIDKDNCGDSRSKRTRSRAFVTVSTDNSCSDDDEKSIDAYIDEDPTFLPPEPKRRRKTKQIDDTVRSELTQQKRTYIRRKPPRQKSTKAPDKNVGKYCRRCDLSFEFRRMYIAHYKDVHSERMPCTLCGKLFHKHNMEKHMVSHSKEKNYVCSLCGARFSYDNNLKAHMRIHSGEKRYKCDFCDESFIHWNTKKNHMYIKHTKIKKYECYICHQMFGQNSTMKNHVRYHTGDLPHPCPFCHKRFISFYKLKKHVVTHRNISADQKERFL